MGWIASRRENHLAISILHAHALFGFLDYLPSVDYDATNSSYYYGGFLPEKVVFDEVILRRCNEKPNYIRSYIRSLRFFNFRVLFGWPAWKFGWSHLSHGWIGYDALKAF